MMRRDYAVAAALLAVATSAQAARVNRDVMATATYRTTITVAAGVTETFETTNLSAGADTVLHLWNGTSEVGFDDDGGVGLASRLVFQNTSGSAVTLSLILRAFSNTSQGTATLLRNAAVVAAVAPVGGGKLSVPCGGVEVYETALAPNGTRDSIMLGLSSGGRMRAIDDDGGVGRASRIAGRTDVCSVVVYPYYVAEPGVTHVYVNDVGADGDGDGLGSALEAELQTCDNKSAPGCSGVFNTDDTDRDGLTDMAEVFGVDHATFPQYLPRWGADPRHKDVFIEVDYASDFASNPLTAQDVLDAQAYFSVGAASSLQNPDGLPGVRLHLDLGVAPTNPAHATSFGDWDCVTTNGCGSSQVPPGTSYGAGADSQRDPIRAGLFHYALIDFAPGGGQGWSPGDRFGWGGTPTNRQMGTFVHELGHNLNLGHHGHNKWGAVNCKPNYRSLMNYAYGGLGFSRTSGNAAVDPSGVSEEQGMGPGQPNTFLTGDPFYYSVSGQAVDWNTDGTYYELMTPVRASVTWGTWQSCNAHDRNAITLLDGVPRAATPAIARRSNRLYVFWVSTDNRIKYRQGLTSGVDHNGSCPGDDELGNECMAFGPEQEVPTTVPAKSVSALTWDDNSVVIAFQSTSADSIRLRRSTGVTADGNLTSWSAESAVSGAFTAVEPQLAALDVSGPHFNGASRVLALAYADLATSQYRFAWAPSPTSAFTITTMFNGTNTAIVGPLSPTLATMPIVGAADRHCAALSDATSHVRLYCYDRAINRWLDVTTQAYGTFSTPTSTGKPGFAYHIQREWDGSVISGDASIGQFYLTVVTDVGFPDLFVSSTLRATMEPRTDLRFTRLGKPGNVWTDLQAGTGMALFEDAGLSALKGAWTLDLATIKRLEFLPLADGTFGATLDDGDDFQVMERGICLGITDGAQRDAVCGAAATTVSKL
jgi:hypothetical protein